MIDLRFIIRDGEKVLQWRIRGASRPYIWSKWADVRLEEVDETK